MLSHHELSEQEAIAAVAKSVRRLFSFVSDQQARDLAAAVLRELHDDGIRIVRAADPDPLAQR